MNELTYREILTNLGYSPMECGDELRMRPIYRDSDNPTSLKVDKKTGNWIDFGTANRGNFFELIKITLDLSSIEEAQEIILNKFHFSPVAHTNVIKLKQPTKFDPDILKDLKPDYSYWINRKISGQTLVIFGGGVCDKGRMKGRYCFPIKDIKGQIIGLTGRSLINSKMKYKHLGVKSFWCFPSNLNDNILKQKKQVILVESPGCILKLWDIGIKNAICLFGVECSLTILNYLIQLDPDKILVSFNNEPGNNSIGNKAAEKLQNKLLRYFDKEQIEIALPFKKDFGEMNDGEITAWALKYHVNT